MLECADENYYRVYYKYIKMLNSQASDFKKGMIKVCESVRVREIFN